MMLKITPTQKRIIGVTTVVVLAFVLVWSFVYLPARSKAAQLQSELKDLEEQIQQIEVMGTEGKTIGEGIIALETKYRQINIKFPEKEEEGLGLLSEFAQKQNLEVLSMGSQPKKSCTFAEKFDGKSCYEVSVSLVMRGTYPSLVLYMETLKKTLPAYVTFNRLGISKEGSAAAIININLDLRLYLLS